MSDQTLIPQQPQPCLPEPFITQLILSGSGGFDRGHTTAFSVSLLEDTMHTRGTTLTGTQVGKQAGIGRREY